MRQGMVWVQPPLESFNFFTKSIFGIQFVFRDILCKRMKLKLLLAIRIKTCKQD